MNLMMPGHAGPLHHMNFGEVRERPPLEWALLRRILRYFRPYWPYALATLAIIGLNAGLGLVPPLLVRDLLDRAVPGRDVRLLLLLLAGMTAAALAGGFLGVAQNYLSTLVGQRVMYDLRNQMYAHLQRLSLRFFTDHRTGEIISRVTNDVGGVQQVVTNTLVATVTNLAVVASTTALVFALDWRLALVSVGVLPFFILPTRRVGRARQRLAAQVQAALAEMNHHMHETLNVSGALLVKVFGRQEHETERFRRQNRELMQLNVRQALVGRWFFMWLGLFGSLGPAVIYGVGGYLAIGGGMSVGTVVAFVALLGRLYGPLSMLLNVHVELYASLALFRRIFEYLDLRPEVQERAGARRLTAVRGRVAFEGVTFSYRPGAPALRDVSFVVEPGQLCALVGPSGAGKTTVTYLLLRLYDPDEGRVTVDGVDLRDLSLASLAEHVGVVTQEPYLFYGTVRENLLYARPGASQAELEEACRAAQVHEVVASLPQGYDTVIGERGYRLSGGEKQRLAIARAILKNPRILILDEATSSLDSHSERLVQEALENLLAGRTSLVIAHRLSTVLRADRILVLDGGRLVEEGNHAELLRRGGLYARLYREQFADVAALPR